jgi:hypothetical protein
MAKDEMEQKTNKVHSRDLELLKIQSLDGYFQTRTNINYSITYAFVVGYVIFTATLYFQGTITSQLISVGTGADFARLLNLIFFLIFLFGFYIIMKPRLERLNLFRDNCLRIIDELVVKVDEGIPLPSLMELKESAFPEKK